MVFGGRSELFWAGSPRVIFSENGIARCGCFENLLRMSLPLSVSSLFRRELLAHLTERFLTDLRRSDVYLGEGKLELGESRPAGNVLLG